MNVTIHYFALLRERRGREVEDVDVEEGLTVRDLFDRIFPPEPDPPPPVLFVMDEEYVSPSTPLRPGARVGFIPPLGGG